MKMRLCKIFLLLLRLGGYMKALMLLHIQASMLCFRLVPFAIKLYLVTIVTAVVFSQHTNLVCIATMVKRNYKSLHRDITRWCCCWFLICFCRRRVQKFKSISSSWYQPVCPTFSSVCTDAQNAQNAQMLKMLKMLKMHKLAQKCTQRTLSFVRWQRKDEHLKCSAVQY